MLIDIQNKITMTSDPFKLVENDLIQTKDFAINNIVRQLTDNENMYS